MCERTMKYAQTGSRLQGRGKCCSMAKIVQSAAHVGMEIAMMTIEVCFVFVFGWCRGEEPGRPGAVVGKNAYDN